MTCGDKFNKNCPTGGTRVSPEEVGGRPICIHPGCGRQLQGNGKCVCHHSQNPAKLARQIVAEIRLGAAGPPDDLLLALQNAGDALQVAERAGDPALLAEIESALPATLQQARERGPLRLADIPGREHVKRALEVAAAGGHEVFLEGHPEQTAPFAAWAKAQGIRVREASPCRCGNYGNPYQECTCRAAEVARWRQRKSYRRARTAAIMVEVGSLSPSEQPRRGESGSHVLARVVAAQHAPVAPLVPDEGSLVLLRVASRQLNMGWVCSMRTLEVARSIARLADSSRLQVSHVAEAIQYRPRRYQEPLSVEENPDPGSPLVFRDAQGQPRPVRLDDIPGQEHVKAALETALAGGHTVGIVAGGGGADDLQPLVDWGRAHGVAITVASPCPCGCYGSAQEECTCSPQMLARHRAQPEYLAALRNDIVVAVTGQVPYDKFVGELRGDPNQREREEVVLQRAAATRALPWRDLTLGKDAIGAYSRLGLLDIEPERRKAVVGVASTLARHGGERVIREHHLATAVQWTLAAQQKQEAPPGGNR